MDFGYSFDIVWLFEHPYMILFLHTAAADLACLMQQTNTFNQCHRLANMKSTLVHLLLFAGKPGIQAAELDIQ